MGRWIACDRTTAEALTSSLPADSAVEVREGDALDVALAGAPTTAILPAGGDDVLYVEVHPAGSDTSPRVEAAGYQAGGFLGLSDEPVYEEDEKPKKKRR